VAMVLETDRGFARVFIVLSISQPHKGLENGQFTHGCPR
jgi:hypothetical protein